MTDTPRPADAPRTPPACAPAADPLAPSALSPVRLAPGTVALVGGGPGALDLITVRGLSLLRQADVVVVDRLGPRELVDLLGPEVEVVEVGKAPGRHSLPQRAIGELLVRTAQAGHRVVRLKGGDPFVLGRGGEEVLACRAAGVEVQVVPGVTSAIAGPAAGDVPLTHRGTAVAAHIVNAHGDLGPADLAALADPGTTTVLLMGVEWLPRLVAQALLSGIDPATPVAIVQEATLPGQREARGTIGTIVEVAREEGIASPAVIVVGRTAAPGFLVPAAEPAATAPPHGAGREAVAEEEVPAAPAGPSPYLIACAHGTRSREGRDVVRALMMRVRDLLPHVPLREAYVDVQSPDLVDVVRALAPACSEIRTRESEGTAAAVVVPLLLSTGIHVGQDIAEAVAGRDAVAAAPLGPDRRLAQVMAERLEEAGTRPDDAIVMAAAGTRDPAGQAMAEEMAALLAEHLGRPVAIAHIAAAQPSVPEAIAAARETGARVALANYLLAPGYFHTLLEQAGADVLAGPLGDHPLVAEVVVDRYQAVLGA